MNSIKIALVFKDKEVAKNFVATNAPNDTIILDSINEFIYETTILEFYWIKAFTNFKGRRFNFIYTTEDIRDTKWFDEVIRPMQIVGTGAIETKVLDYAT